MSVVCVDTSGLTAIAFDEPGAPALAGWLDEFTRLVSSNLLEAELRAAFAREEVTFPEGALDGGACGMLPEAGASRRLRTGRPEDG